MAVRKGTLRCANPLGTVVASARTLWFGDGPRWGSWRTAGGSGETVGVTKNVRRACRRRRRPAVALGVGELVAAASRPGPRRWSRSAARSSTTCPSRAKNWPSRLFGTYDKIALQVGTAVLLAVIAAVLGILAARRLWIGLGRHRRCSAPSVPPPRSAGPASDARWVVPSLVGAPVAGGALWLLLRLARANAPDARRADPASPRQPAEHRPAALPTAAGSALGWRRVGRLLRPAVWRRAPR